MDDEFIIKRKLTFDGDGLGDDRRINLLQKMIAKWILGNNSPAENQNYFDKICSHISAVEQARLKAELIYKSYEKDCMNYLRYRKQMEENISNIKTTIETSKALLVEVKKRKQQKLLYDMIAKDIAAKPPRKETSETIKELKNNLLNLKEKETNIGNELSICKKHCSVIISNANQLNDNLNNPDLNKKY